MVPGNLALHLDFDGYVPQVLRNERALLRVCQEAVSNVIRHSQAGRVKVSVRVREQHVYLRVLDDGRGVGKRPPRGFGFASMERRLDEIGGSLRIRPRRPKGTIVEATVPRLDAESERNGRSERAAAPTSIRPPVPRPTP